MDPSILAEAARRADLGEPFVLATVVWRRGPTSGQPGAKAIVGADGSVRGWLGGACAEPTVVDESLAALRDGRPRVLFLGPADELDGHRREGVTAVPMACSSEGAMEVSLEPFLPAPLVVAIGRSPIVDSLARMALAVGWRAVVIDDGGGPEHHHPDLTVATSLDLSELGIDRQTFVLVATQGHYDEDALQAALATQAGYVGLIASGKRAADVVQYLRERGVEEEGLARVRAPAGLDLGSVPVEEVAVAVLAEMVALRATRSGTPVVEVEAPPPEVDPVCGMVVDPATARFQAEYDGRSFWFCAPGCQRAFEREPELYAGV